MWLAADEAEDRDAHRAEGVFWVPKEGRWSYLQANTKQPTIWKIVDDAMDAIERALFTAIYALLK